MVVKVVLAVELVLSTELAFKLVGPLAVITGQVRVSKP
jgi:hypothetical protein